MGIQGSGVALDNKRAAALAAFPACIAQSFDVAGRVTIEQGGPESIGAILERAAKWAAWAAEKLEQEFR